MVRLPPEMMMIMMIMMDIMMMIMMMIMIDDGYDGDDGITNKGNDTNFGSTFSTGMR